MISDIKKNKINECIQNSNNKLIFVHTPKCSGTYVGKIIKDLNISNCKCPNCGAEIKNSPSSLIENLGHKQATVNNDITFTVIRHPVDRFESLLNFRLGKENPLDDWPSQLLYLFNEEDCEDLNSILDKLSDEEILSFTPFHSLQYWGKNVKIFLLIDELEEFLNMNGFYYDKSKYSKVNVSEKKRGILNIKNRDRIAKLYENDMKLYEKWCIKKL